MDKINSDLFESFVEQLVEHTRLTERQAQVYTLRRCNYSSQRIAANFDISSEAVNSHYSSARDKFSMNVSMEQLHFYESASGRVPLYWEEVIDVGTDSYVLSKPCVELIEEGVMTLENGVYFVTVHNRGDVGSDHIIIEDTSVEEYGKVLRECFNSELSSEDGDLFEAFYHQVVDGVSLREFYLEVFGGSDMTLTTEFLGSLGEETRFVVFSESGVFQQEDEVFVGSSIETGNLVSLDDVNSSGWLSVVGKIGSGKTFTLDLITGQLSCIEDTEVIEFNPFREKNDVVEHEIYSDASAIDGNIDEWFDSVVESVENENVVYAVFDEAHYLSSGHIDKFVELIELSFKSQYLTLITSTQTIEEFLEDERMKDYAKEATWLFQKLDAVKDDTPMYVPRDVTYLNSNERKGDFEAILSGSNQNTGLKYFVSFDGVSASQTQ